MKLKIFLLLLISASVFAQRTADKIIVGYTTTTITSALNKAMAAITGSGIANQLTYWTGASTIGSLSTVTYPSPTELSYVKGVTSSIQTQLDGKASSSHTHTIANITNLQTTLGSKQSTLVAGINIKTFNGISPLGSGNMVIAADTAGLWLKTYNIVKSLLIGETLIGTAAELNSMILDYRKNNYLRADE